MTQKDPNIFYALISKYLAGEASAEETKQLESWLEESAVNRNEFNQIKKIWEAANSSQDDQIFNVNSAWAKLQQRIKSEEKPLRSISMVESRDSFLFYFSRIAAGLLILISIYLLFRLSDEAGPNKILIASERVVFDTLADQSIVALRQNSKLIYPENFNERERSVNLDGEAFFKVTPNPEKAFVVKVEGAEIRVLGTSFLVQAYDSLQNIKVSVEEGRVQVSTSKDSVVLSAGQSILIDKKSKTLHAVEQQSNEFYWMSDVLVFKSEDLDKVFQQLQEHFQIEIKVKNEKILNCKLTAKFEDESIDQIFNVIAANFDLKIHKSNKNYSIDGDGCK